MERSLGDMGETALLSRTAKAEKSGTRNKRVTQKWRVTIGLSILAHLFLEHTHEDSHA